jgi:hypothetical protein
MGTAPADPQSTSLLTRASTFQMHPLVKVEDPVYQGWDVIHPRARAIPDASPLESVVSGNAFADGPVTGSLLGEQPITGFHGSRYASSNRRGLGTFTGVLRSSFFTIRGDVIDFLIGGGKNTKLTSFSLFIARDGGFEQVRLSAADNNLSLERKRWDVSPFKGSQAYFEIRDEASVGPWLHTDVLDRDRLFGFLAVDDIRQLDSNGNRVSEAEDNQHNFDFEQLKTPEHPITLVPPSSGDDDANQSSKDFVIGNSGRLHWTMKRNTVNPSVDIPRP